MKAVDYSMVLDTDTHLTLRPGDVAYNAGPSRPWTSERPTVLAEHGVVEKTEEEGSNPRYRTTELGQRYPAGEVDPEDLEVDG